MKLQSGLRLFAEKTKKTLVRSSNSLRSRGKQVHEIELAQKTHLQSGCDTVSLRPVIYFVRPSNRFAARAALFSASLSALAVTPAVAAALWSGKPTDSSVCDLTPSTTFLLSRKAFVPASTPMPEAAEAYTRLAARFVLSSCTNHQTLLLHSEDSDPLDAHYLPFFANSLCTSAQISRTEMTSRSLVLEQEQKGFELRCKISKMETFRSAFEKRESVESTQSFIGKLQSKAQREASGGSRPISGAAKDDKDCGKLDLSSILRGGKCASSLPGRP